ncbi:MFS transporter [Nocardia harenae]|uniref:MFS transporter n=1 Tax=Nocardia harenae TaxID=358707 RepID=UPI0008337281|nr:MFS transporter [Nocardia harenae]
MSADTTAAPPAHSDLRWKRLVGVFALTNTVTYGAFIQAFTVLLIPMSEALAASRTEVTAAATISTLAGALAAVPVGNLLDRYGGRLLMAAGSVIGVAAVLLWSRATGLPQLYLAFALAGLALAMSTYEAAFAVLVVVTDTRHRDGAIIAVTMICGLATSFYYFLVGWLEGQLGWRNALLVLALILAVVAVPAHLWAIPGRTAHSLRVTGRHGVPVGKALRSPGFWFLLVAFVAQSGVTAAFLLMMVSWFRDVGFSPTVAAALPIAVGVLQIAARMGLAPLSRRFGMARVTAVSFAVQGAGLLALPLAGTSLPLTLACIAAFGLGYGISVVAKPSIVADTFGVARFGSILALMAVPTALSRAGTPLAAAWLADWRFLVLLGAACLLAALALLPVARPVGRTAEPAT